mgnify:FL=1
MKLKYAGIALASAGLLFAAGCSSDSTDETDTAAATAEASPSAMESESSDAGTIVDVAVGNDDFSTLVAAVQAADLQDTLSADGPYTVFAPTNAAFEALPDGVLDKLLEPENKDTLKEILTYHVVSGEVTSDMIEPGDVETVEGSTVTITTDGGEVMVNEAKVETADVDASNGVIHSIDAVLLPEDVDPADL